MTRTSAGKILLIGWDGADWDVITPLLDSGSMPNFESLVDRGVMGNLASPAPRICPMLWTSMATGRRPDVHRILTADEADPLSGGRRPVPSTRREVEAVWEMAARGGLRSHAVNWPASHPAESIRGVSVSERFPRIAGQVDEPWPLADGSIRPAELADSLAELRVHPADIDGATLRAFIPHASEIDQDSDRSLEEIATILAESASVHAAATWLLEHDPCDFMAVHYGGIGRASLRFMRYHPPQLPHISDRDFRLHRGIVSGIYRFHDLLLGRLIELAGPEATILLVSDHGFHVGRLRPARTTFAEEEWYGRTGILVAAGPRLKRDARIDGADLLDIAPTILALLDLPIPRDLEGLPLIDAFADPEQGPRLTREPGVPRGRIAEPETASADDPAELQDALAELAGSCQVDDARTKVREAALERQDRFARVYNLARVYLERGRVAEAAECLESLLREDPAESQFALALARCRLVLGQYEECRTLVARSLDRPEDRAAADYFLGRAAMLEGRPDDAFAYLRRAERSAFLKPELACHIGDAYAALGRWGDAENIYRRAVAVDNANLAGQLGLARACLEQGAIAGALTAAREAIAMRHDDARARYLLGVGLERIGAREEAVEAYEACLKMHPRIPDARNRLIALRRRIRELMCSHVSFKQLG